VLAKEVSMKTFVMALVALLVIGGAGLALAQQDNQSQAQAPASQPAPADSQKGAPSGNDAPKASDGSRGDVKVETQIRTDRGSDDAAGAASPRTEVTRTSFFGLSPTAAIIVSVAVLLVVVLAIVAMTNSRGTTYIERDRGL
jgi:hypothetical protein